MKLGSMEITFIIIIALVLTTLSRLKLLEYILIMEIDKNDTSNR
jgi:hypothetical protein